MGRLTPHARRGLVRLACVIGGIAAASLLPSGWGGPWVLILLYAAFAWVWQGFRRKSRRGPARALRTRRLVMRRPLPADVDSLHAMLSDPETTRHWSTPPHAARTDTEDWLQRIATPEAPALCDDFVIVRRGRVIGMLGSVRLPWVSFLIDRSEWGQGYAAEALAAFAPYMFERGLTYLYAATDTRNAAARALLVKARFRECGRSNGVWLVGGEPSEAVHYRLNRDGSEPDLDKERKIIAAMEAATAEHRRKLAETGAPA